MQNQTPNTAAAPCAAPAISHAAPAGNTMQKLLQRLGFCKTRKCAEDAPATPAASINIFDYEAMKAARENAAAWQDYVLECANRNGTKQENTPAQETPAPKLGEIPESVLHGIIASAFSLERFFISFSGFTRGQPPVIMTVPREACIVDFHKEKAETIAEMIPQRRCLEIIAALARRAKQ